MTIWRMRIACRITKITDTHSEYAIFIAFPPQQWLNEHASMLRCSYIACLVRSSTLVRRIWKTVFFFFYNAPQRIVTCCYLWNLKSPYHISSKSTPSSTEPVSRYSVTVTTLCAGSPSCYRTAVTQWPFSLSSRTNHFRSMFKQALWLAHTSKRYDPIKWSQIPAHIMTGQEEHTIPRVGTL